MTVEEIVEKFKSNPSYLHNGAGYLAKQWGCTKDEVKIARNLVRGGKQAVDYFAEQPGKGYSEFEIDMSHGWVGNSKTVIDQWGEDKKAEWKESQKNVNSEPQLKSESVDSEGNKQIEYISDKPLDKKQIEDLYGVDNITSILTNYWNKQQGNGSYLISAHIKCLINNFYSADELKIKLIDLFPRQEVVKLPKVVGSKEEALFIYIADDHCGGEIKNSIFGRENSGKSYTERLLQIVQEVKALDRTFEEINIINLGDELDGYNAKTTRYDHSVDARSNKEQFDTYVTARRLFYYELFISGLSEEYFVGSLNNSNHSGLGFSYMANKALEIYLEAKFPDVSVTNTEDFITTYTYGKHKIAFTHGKDERYMKHPFPLNLDPKTDLWIMEYFSRIEDDKDYPYKSVIKGDLHKYNVNQGKFGRYVNVPSISSGSSYIEHNYGDSKPGALLEIVPKNSENIISIPLWF